MRATDLLRQDHRKVHDMFLELEARSADGAWRRGRLREIVQELAIHAEIEEAAFYPAVRAVSRRLDDARAAHAHLRRMIAEVESHDAASDDFVAAVRSIQQIVLAHVMEEEGGIFLDAERLGADEMERLGAELEQRKRALLGARAA